MTQPSLLLFDTASVYFRAFFGLPSTMRAADGRPVNAVRGLLDYLARFIGENSPTELACCWDNSWRPAWRVALVPGYKAQRVAAGDLEEVPAELTAQIPMIDQVLRALGIPIVGADGYEADDVIATLARASTVPTEVVTGDRDLFQVVDDARQVRVLYLGRGAGRYERVDQSWLLDHYGVSPDQYVDFATLRGDPSDGLPGVAGIGEKTAAALLNQHGSLENILAAADAGQLTPRLTAALTASLDYLGAAKVIVRAETNVGLDRPDLSLPAAPVAPDRFAELSAELNLGSAAQRVVTALAQARST